MLNFIKGTGDYIVKLFIFVIFALACAYIYQAIIEVNQKLDTMREYFDKKLDCVNELTCVDISCKEDNNATRGELQTNSN